MTSDPLIQALDKFSKTEEIAAELRKQHGDKAEMVARFYVTLTAKDGRSSEHGKWAAVLLLLTGDGE